ncbi:gamma carbonic anhydrase family protein [Lacibacterium aquatile]|uniref:Gamma carbonic anhydrase family protein n=1 Tax=Lacibacterium aquatile TaxID=1168082 RepID=A0ABW5DPW7_9PROT
MLLDHGGKRPVIDSTARIAPTAVICGDVTIGPGTSIGFGAVITAESGSVSIGADCVVMENAVLRGVVGAPLRIGNGVMIGPHASLTGCTLEDAVFVATGCALFNGARIGQGSVVRINGIVHVGTVLPEKSVVPIGWVAVGDPVTLLPPDRHDEISALLKQQNFVGRVFGIDEVPPGQGFTQIAVPRYAAALVKHHGDDAEV